MRVLYLYLAVYFALLAGAVFALWDSGILARISPLWAGLTVATALGLGILLAVTSRTTTDT